MTRTVLINPPYSLEERYGRSIKQFGAVTEPLGLAYLAAALEAAGHAVAILDAPAMTWDIGEVVDRIATEGWDLMGVTLLTPMFASVRDLLREVRQSSPRTRIIVGGAHASALPERTLEEIPEIDFLCVGEGEETLVHLVSTLDGRGLLENVPGLAFRRNGRIIRNADRPLIKNLDLLPKPARHLLPMDHYQLTASRTKGSGFCPTLIVARGCPFDCQYCSHPSGRTFRHHSVERIIEELKDLKNFCRVSQVNLEADTLTLDRTFIQALCRRFIEERLDLQWTCESRVDTVDEETLQLMKRAGCWQISYGVESGVQRLLDSIHKGVTREKIEKTFLATKRAGITIRGFFMVGLPGETPSDTLETIHFARKLDPLWAQFTITIPYPGTPMYQDLMAKGLIRHEEWSHYNTWGGWANGRLPYVPECRTEEEIKEMQKKALRMFYMRPKVMLRFLMSVTSAADMVKYVRGLGVLIRTAAGDKTGRS
jgi:anaerobic magnesium-protoporphyrin IX monomethyl ester cyclase